MGCLEDIPSASITQTGTDASGIGDSGGGTDGSVSDASRPDAANDARPEVSVDINADTPGVPDATVTVDSATLDGTVNDGGPGDAVTTDGGAGDATPDGTVADGSGVDASPDIPTSDGGQGDVITVDATPDATFDVGADVAADVVVDASVDASADVVADATPDAIFDGGIVDAVADVTPDGVVVDAMVDTLPDVVVDALPDGVIADVVPDATPDVEQDLIPIVTCADMFNDCQPALVQICNLVNNSPCLDLLLADYAANGCPATCGGISLPGLDDFCTDPVCGQFLTLAQTVGIITDQCTSCFCPVDCVPGETECNGDVLSTCTQSASGCPVYVDEDCSLNGGTCDDGQDPAQCAGGGGTCTFDVCAVANGPPPPGCDDPCVETMCQQDPFCCNAQWDTICVSNVPAVCGIDCTPGEISCNEQYESPNPGYYECTGGPPGECFFGHNTNALGSCAAYCAQQGGECVDTYNNQGACGLGQDLGCGATGFQSVICVCSQGCGGGEPCDAGDICINGSCQ